MTNSTNALIADQPPLLSKRTIANRLNALKSTGPKTEAGKASSRRNSLKTGLTGKGVVLPETVELDHQARVEGYMQSFSPQTQDEIDLVREAALAMTLHDHWWRELLAARVQSTNRAETSWHLDRIAEAEELAKGLRRSPALTVARLKRTCQGARKLVDLWRGLGERLEHNGEWTPEQRELALDLLGVPAEFRGELTPIDISAPTPEARLDLLLDFVVDRIGELNDSIENGLADSDADDRDLVMNHQVFLHDKTVDRLMRQERALSRRIETALRRLAPLKQRAEAASKGNAPEKTKPIPSTSAASAPAPRPSAPTYLPPAPASWEPSAKTNPMPPAEFPVESRRQERDDRRSRRAEAKKERRRGALAWASS